MKPDCCPSCLSLALNYIGIDDGYDDGVCDVWECCQCGYEFTDGCIDYDDDLSDPDEPIFPNWSES